MAVARGHFNFTATTLPESQQHSPWHSPVPYLFGGLAAMLGLVAFALLILACSYWKLSGHFDARNDGNSPQDPQDLEAGTEKEGENHVEKKKDKVLEEKIVVIVAGRANTMFLATPILSPGSSNRSPNSSGNSNSNGSTRLSCFEESECGSVGQKTEKLAGGEAEMESKQGESDRVDHSRDLENQGGSDQSS